VKLAGIFVWSEMLTSRARLLLSVLMIVANAVAVFPTWTDRLVGKIAATNDCADAVPT
jgi:hypothetical protein